MGDATFSPENVRAMLERAGPFRAHSRHEVLRLSYGALIGKPDVFGIDVTWLPVLSAAGFRVVEADGHFELRMAET